jgi:hypothetical protein
MFLFGPVYNLHMDVEEGLLSILSVYLSRRKFVI